MLNICTKCTVLSHDVIRLNKTYGEYVSRKENTKADSFVLQNEDESYKWDRKKIDPVKNEVNTENIKTEGNINTEQDYNKEEYVQKTINRVPLEKQEKK